MSRGLRWWLPDVAMAAACVTLVYCLFLFHGTEQLFRDSDAGWHIRNGEAILASGTLPRTDPWSFTRAGQPWFAWEWLSDVVTGAIHRGFGLKGVALFYAAAIASCVWLWFRLHWALGGHFLIACAMAPLLLSTCNIHWLARPHVLSWLFLLWTMFPGDPSLLRAAALTAVWANVHPSFFFAALRGAGLRPARMLKLLAVVAAVPLLNPYGIRLYQHVWRYLADSELLARIGEFQSFDFHTAGAGQIIAAVILGLVGGTLALTQKRVHHFVVAVAITAMALRSARALPLVALLLLPPANAAITRALSGYPAFLRYGANLRALDARFHGLALVPLVLLAVWKLMPPAGFPPAQFPVAAYSHIPAGARLFAPDKYGGYLIYRSNGRMKVFFDGRSDLYGADFLRRYGRMMALRPGWREYFDSFGFTHALVPADAPIGAALEQSGWREIYRDRVAILLERPAARAANRPLPAGAFLECAVRNLLDPSVLKQNIGRIATPGVSGRVFEARRGGEV